MGAFTEEQLKEIRQSIDTSDKNKDGEFDTTEQDAFRDILFASETVPYAALDAAWQAFTNKLADTDGDGKFTTDEVIAFFEAYNG